MQAAVEVSDNPAANILIREMGGIGVWRSWWPTFGDTTTVISRLEPDLNTALPDDPRDTTTLDRASDLGIAFQLSNIARDVAEDAAADRCYLPVEWMVELDIPPGQHMHPAYRARLAVMARPRSWAMTASGEVWENRAGMGAAQLRSSASRRCSR